MPGRTRDTGAMRAEGAEGRGRWLDRPAARPAAVCPGCSCLAVAAVLGLWCGVACVGARVPACSGPLPPLGPLPRTRRHRRGNKCPYRCCGATAAWLPRPSALPLSRWPPLHAALGVLRPALVSLGMEAPPLLPLPPGGRVLRASETFHTRRCREHSYHWASPPCWPSCRSGHRDPSLVRAHSSAAAAYWLVDRSHVHAYIQRPEARARPQCTTRSIAAPVAGRVDGARRGRAAVTQ